MIIKPFKFHGEAVRIDVEDKDRAILEDKKPTGMDWLGRTVAKITLPGARCNAANVIGSAIIYVPEFDEITEGEKLEAEIKKLIGFLTACLKKEGFSISDDSVAEVRPPRARDAKGRYIS